MQLRIAHVTATFPPYRGGTGNVCYHNARELARLGQAVTVLTAAMPAAPATETIDGFRVRRLRPFVQIGNAPLLPSLAWALQGLDLIHLHYPFIIGAEMVALISALTGTPLVVSFHNDLIGTGARERIFSQYQRLSARLAVARATQLCVVSQDHYAHSRLRKDLGWREPAVLELPNGVDTYRFKPDRPNPELRNRYGIPPEAGLILFVAALDRAHHFKGLERLLQIMPDLPDDTWLLVVGDGDMRAAYEQQAAFMGIRQRIVFAGAVDHQQTPAYFRSADVTVLPSAPPESFGLVLIESLACGTPVIAHDIPGVRTVVNNGHDGFLVPVDDQKMLIHSIRLVLADDALRRMMGQQGRIKVEAHYGWEAIGRQLEFIYRLVLDKRTVSTQITAQGE
ncbi:MAG: glycosyltransferase family 4 protein [Chloroflexales bacterium]|nr:glycosyltransferase family 4 protein [Chloroflexales bacterium]